MQFQFSVHPLTFSHLMIQIAQANHLINTGKSWVKTWALYYVSLSQLPNENGNKYDTLKSLNVSSICIKMSSQVELSPLIIKDLKICSEITRLLKWISFFFKYSCSPKNTPLQQHYIYMYMYISPNQ